MDARAKTARVMLSVFLFVSSVVCCYLFSQISEIRKGAGLQGKRKAQGVYFTALGSSLLNVVCVVCGVTVCAVALPTAPLAYCKLS